MTVAAAIRHGADRLRGIETDNPRLDARLLLAHALGTTPEALIRDLHLAVETTAFEALLDRRAAREPMAHLLGHREFWSLDLTVSSATLIPRPDSETIVEAALAATASHPGKLRVLDLGTGSGCLLLAVLHERLDATGVGIDRSPAALMVAARNARALGMAERALFVCADWDSALRGASAATSAGRFDLILSNPPYIPSADIAGLMPEVAWHEPRTALDGGADGLDAYRRIIPALPDRLTPDGVAVVEVGIHQAEAVCDLATGLGLAATRRMDLAGIPRAVVLRRPGL
ncbi:MAG: peptide chain release factor N(5)-glutamine methyltransferase [Acetobacteraceae bacterium]